MDTTTVPNKNESGVQVQRTPSNRTASTERTKVSVVSVDHDVEKQAEAAAADASKAVVRTSPVRASVGTVEVIDEKHQEGGEKKLKWWEAAFCKHPLPVPVDDHAR